MKSFDSAPEQTAVASNDPQAEATARDSVQGSLDQTTENEPKPSTGRRGALKILAFLFVAIVVGGVLFAIFANKGTKLTDAESQLTRDLEIKVDLETPRSKEKTGKKGKSNSKQAKTTKQANSAATYECICDLFDDAPPDSTDHPLDSCLEVARCGLSHIRKNYDDYTASLVKRERIDGKLGNEEFLFIKVRHEKKVGEKIVQPLSFYLKFLAPKSVAGREVIWVQGRDDDRMIAHGNGLTSFFKVHLHPTDKMAMYGNRYPLTELGIETLALRMLQKGRQDQKHGECNVNIDRHATINDRPCTKIQIVHPDKQPYFEFHIAEIFIDDEYNVPVRYAAYSWPAEKGGEPVLEEEYTYRDLKFNVGLTSKDFNPKNPDYAFP